MTYYVVLSFIRNEDGDGDRQGAGADASGTLTNTKAGVLFKVGEVPIMFTPFFCRPRARLAGSGMASIPKVQVCNWLWSPATISAINNVQVPLGLSPA